MNIRAGDWMALLAAGDYSDLYFEESKNFSIRYEDDKVEEMATGSDRGLGLRVLVQNGGHWQTHYASLGGWDLKEAAALSEGLFKGMSRGPGKKPESEPRVFSFPVRRPHGEAGLREKTDTLAAVNRIVRRGFPYIRQVSLSYGERTKSVGILTSRGEWSREERASTIFTVNVVAEKDGLLQTGHEVLGAAKGLEAFEEVSLIELGRKAAQRAVNKLLCPPARAAEVPVVISSSAGGTLIHEAIGHSLEADHVQEGTSPAYAGRIGKQVAGEFLTIIDDPTLPFYRGSYGFDDEGIKASQTILVKDGVLRDYLYDGLCALKDSRFSNGHGRRESYHSRPIPRMSNLYVAPGKDDPREIVRSLGKGLLVTRMGGGQVNTATGEFVFEVDEGFWVEEGVVRHQVRDANLLGVGPEVLSSIDRLGWDIGWAIGTCGKAGQGVPVADGVPTLRIPKILVGGKK